MSNLTILPADTYTVINKTYLSDNDRKIISMLYQPIIGTIATSLYFTLLDDLEKLEILDDELTHHHLMMTMQIKLEDILIAREKLEAIGLIKTYLKKDNINHYMYLLYSPMSPNEFFNHPVLNIVLYNNLGKTEYNKLVSYFRLPRVVLKDYEDITATFNDVFETVRGNVLEIEEELIDRNSNNIYINNGVDFNLLISSIPESNLNKDCFNEDTKELINALSFTYNLKTLDMQGLIRDSINERGLIDKTKLRKSCRDYYQFENAGNLPTLIYNKQPDFLKKPDGDNSKRAKLIYAFENLTPYQFLKAKYKGAEPTKRDKTLIETLLIEQKLNPGVVNVLIAYCLKTDNEQLKKSYVETIAGQWKRLKIETVEEAMNTVEKEHKKFRDNKTPKTKTVQKVTYVKDNYNKDKDLPEWWEKSLNKQEMTEEDTNELDELLKGLI